MNWFWWIVPTSFSSSLCAVRMIAAAGTSYRSRTFRPDDPVLDVVDDPAAVLGADLAGALEQVHQAEPLAVQRHRPAALELDRHHLRLVRRQLRAGDELEHVVARRLVDVLDRAALGRAAPDVVVDRVRGRLACRP